ncbi:hypothetical protein DLAC_00171 [Tieghemostelium lacteum]|uniref:Leucine-rich repeat-containing protein (LRR) n=1 Tax=Tieghemostelium lacteum TaxID=361077 RepID=A0A152A913_TIELA|nr:hypothetical protein DLAC_00171 [Tieghemostelium lacteum]|eukprot:KYR02709.1 hypothetical protein DLAC_00171 [Tieghemostelium lacteum]
MDIGSSSNTSSGSPTINASTGKKEIPKLNLNNLNNQNGHGNKNNNASSASPIYHNHHSISQLSNPPPPSPSSKRACKLFKEFCNKYIHLHTVHLKLNNSTELISISEALKQRHYINHLNISHNKQCKDLESWIAFGLALKSPTQTLVQLDLSHNYLAPEGLSPIIADIVKSNKSIQWMNLSHNNLDQDEDHAIIDALKYNQTITYLDMSCNEYQLSSDISKYLCNYIEKSKSLTYLNFSHNSTRTPLSGLSASLKLSQNLRHLDLSYMVISGQDSLEFLKTVISSSNLSVINLYQLHLQQQSNSCHSFGCAITNSLSKRYNDYDLHDDLGEYSSHKNSNGNHQKITFNIKSLTPTGSYSSNDSDDSDSNQSSEETTSDEMPLMSCPLTYLNIGGINFGKKSLKEFLNILIRNQDLLTLDLSSGQLSESNGTLLADFIRINQNIQHLNLCNNDFYEKSVDIAEALQFNTSLISLNISNSKSSNLIGKVLSKSLTYNRTLKKLNISHTKLSSSGILELSLALKDNRIQLQSLNLDDTDLSEKGSILIGDALATNQHLEMVYMNFNSIQYKGSKSIGKALKHNNTLKVLHLGYNQIGVKGLKSISKYLKSNSTLKELSIKNNLIPEKGGIILTDALKSNHSLETLNLRGNLLGMKFGNSLSKLLQQNSTLASLDLSHNHLPKDMVYKIYQFLKKKNNNNNNIGNSLSYNQSYDDLSPDNLSPKSIELPVIPQNVKPRPTPPQHQHQQQHHHVNTNHQHTASELTPNQLKLLINNNEPTPGTSACTSKNINLNCSSSLPSRREISPYASQVNQNRSPQLLGLKSSQINQTSQTSNKESKRNSQSFLSSPITQSCNVNSSPSNSLPNQSPILNQSMNSTPKIIFLKEHHTMLFERIDS